MAIRSASLVRVLAVLVLLLGLVIGGAGVLAMLTLDRVVDAFGGTGTSSTVEQSLRSADQALEQTRLALGDVERLAGSVAMSSERAAEVVAGAGELTAGRIPDTLRDIESAMPSLIEAGAAIDGTLRALSLFGVEYDPGTPFDEALIELDEGLDGLPEQIEAQGELLGGVGAHLEQVGSETDAVSARVAEVNEALAETEEATGRLATIASRLHGVTRAVGPGAIALQVLFGVLGLLSVAIAVVLWGIARRIDVPAR
jgi:hypothetical protein